MATTMSASRLFQPKEWRGKLLPSRVLLAPINTGFTRGGRPTTRLLRYHQIRSGPAIGISMVGNVAVDRQAASNTRTAVLATPGDVGRFAVVARAIQKSGSLAGIQLAHSMAGLTPSRKWKHHDIVGETARLQELLSSTSRIELARNMARFTVSAKLAARAGYDVVQIHAAHGYLLSMLLSPVINVRTDYYSPSGPWLRRFVEEMRSAIGDQLFSIRLNLITGLAPEEEEVAFSLSLATLLAELGVDIVDFSAGLYTINRHLIYPGHDRDGPNIFPTVLSLSKEIPGLVAVAGRIVNLAQVPADITDNLLVSIGRPMIADPAFAQKSREGRYDTINHCALKGHCHYFTRGRNQLECGVNADV